MYFMYFIKNSFFQNIKFKPLVTVWNQKWPTVAINVALHKMSALIIFNNLKLNVTELYLLSFISNLKVTILLWKSLVPNWKLLIHFESHWSQIGCYYSTLKVISPKLKITEPLWKSLVPIWKLLFRFESYNSHF